MRDPRFGGTLVPLAALVLALGTACGSEGAEPGDELCGNAVDDDGDGQTDCADADCTAAPNCVAVTTEFDCDDLRDDDGDGDTDCDDADCTLDELCNPSREYSCSNGVDDDSDGDTDCDDSDCRSRSVCAEADCANAVDDDGDGDTDCADADCTDDPACGGTPESNCTDGLDDDGDGATDCADTDCAAAPTCLPETNCTNTVDDDGDGAADCADSDCAADPACAPATETNCTNTVDDDLDGSTDCADPDCSADPACPVTGGDSCTSGPFALPDDPDGTWHGTTTGLVADHRGSCGSTSGEDVVFTFDLTVRRIFTADTIGSDFNTLLYLRTDACTPGTELDCDDDGAGSGDASRISMTLDAGTYWLVVDGNSGADGNYVLNIALTDLEVCNDSLDNDGDGDTDCADADCARDGACFELVCDDTTDNDGDGDTDCVDADCTYNAACMPACADDTHEPNDSRPAATDETTITTSEWLGVTNTSDDYFSIAVCVGAVVTIDVLFGHALGDIDIYLQSTGGTGLAQSNGNTDDEHVSWTSDRLGTVYLRVDLYGADTCNLYHLDVSVDTTACP